MKIKQIHYERVQNLGNYESERIGLTAELSDDDIPEEIVALLKQKFELMRLKRKEEMIL